MVDKILRNCKFKFQCEQQWEHMSTTDNEDIRFCSKCNETVHLCTNAFTLEMAVRENKCVALFAKEKDKIPRLLGDMEFKYEPECK